MKRIVSLLALVLAVATGCGSSTTQEIHVVSRENGSGTRGAFIELFGIEEKGADGSKKDLTTKEAVIAKQTSVMMNNIANDKAAIGYISLGSLNETVKAVQIEGVSATAENVKNASYPVSRPFLIATRGAPEGLAKDFVDFILSSEGQQVVATGYIAVDDNAPAYQGSKPSGKLVIAGSSSVSPVMEKLKKAYLALNSNAVIEIQETDSSSGIKSLIDNSCDIAMASRALKESEQAEISATQIALDGIAIILNNENAVTSLTKEQVKSIFKGEITQWNSVSN